VPYYFVAMPLLVVAFGAEVGRIWRSGTSTSASMTFGAIRQMAGELRR